MILWNVYNISRYSCFYQVLCNFVYQSFQLVELLRFKIGNLWIKSVSSDLISLFLSHEQRARIRCSHCLRSRLSAQLHLTSRFALIRFRPVLGMRARFVCVDPNRSAAVRSRGFRFFVVVVGGDGGSGDATPSSHAIRVIHPCRVCGRTYTCVCVPATKFTFLQPERSYRSDYHARLTWVSTTICSPTRIARFDTATFVVGCATRDLLISLIFQISSDIFLRKSFACTNKIINLIDSHRSPLKTSLLLID